MRSEEQYVVKYPYVIEYTDTRFPGDHIVKFYTIGVSIDEVLTKFWNTHSTTVCTFIRAYQSEVKQYNP